MTFPKFKQIFAHPTHDWIFFRNVLIAGYIVLAVGILTLKIIIWLWDVIIFGAETFIYSIF